jgi:hypothetical protein
MKIWLIALCHLILVILILDFGELWNICGMHMCSIDVDIRYFCTLKSCSVTAFPHKSFELQLNLSIGTPLVSGHFR